MSSRGWLEGREPFEWSANEPEPAKPAMTRGKVMRALKQFGHDSFRPLQEDIVRDSLAGKDVFAVLPTGGGKSLCYQLPAVLSEGTTLVVSPLIALMKDQVDALNAKGFRATFLNSTLEYDEYRERMSDLDNYQLVYVAPERLYTSFTNRLPHVRAIVVDEAHCVSSWGHDFRPEFRDIGQLRQQFPEASLSAYTASATPCVQEDIVRTLKLRDPKLYVASFNRSNFLYRVVPKFHQELGDVVRRHPNCSGLVYAIGREKVESLAEGLQSLGARVAAYHAGMDGRQRAEVHESWLSGETDIICATVAFGMGIDKPNVRFVVHYDAPRDLESYYQETGRAGRDGELSECVLLWDILDMRFHFNRAKEIASPDERKRTQNRILRMAQFAELKTCRRVFLLGYLGEEFSGPCGACDICLKTA